MSISLLIYLSKNKKGGIHISDIIIPKYNLRISTYEALIITYTKKLIVLSEIYEELKINNSQDELLYYKKKGKYCDNPYPYIKSPAGKFTYLPKAEYAAKKESLEQAAYLKACYNTTLTEINSIEYMLEHKVRPDTKQPHYSIIRKQTEEQIENMNKLISENNKNTGSTIPYSTTIYDEYGNKYRSRGELLIKNIIDKCALQAVYEYEFLDKKNHVYFSPDFTGYHWNQKYIIEYFGLISDEKYKESMIRKLTEYKKSGYTTDKNLIAFCSEDAKDMDMRKAFITLLNFSVYGKMPGNIVLLDSKMNQAKEVGLYQDLRCIASI